MTIIRRRPLNEQALPNLTSLNPLLQRVYAARAVNSIDELDTSLNALLPYHSLKDIDKATDRLFKAISSQQRILIVGDFDADGATSTALAISALRRFGAKNVEYLVPNRFEYGYGLTPAIIDVADHWKPDLIITVDNGISSIEGVNKANEKGMDVLITDHHLASEQLPNACAIINPNQPGDCFPSKCIAGVGVIFYLMLAFRRKLIENNWFKENDIPNMGQFLDLVALGTVADVVTLDKNNRIMVSQGIKRIKKGAVCPGIVAILQVANRELSHIQSSDLGFAVGPRLNAAGRLDDMSLGIECLLSDTAAKAIQMAKELDSLNQERKHIEQDMKTKAYEIIKRLKLNEKTLPVALCMYDKSWHQGVIGILAGRIKEKYNRPVIAFADAGNGELKGSARSVSGIHIRDTLDAIAKKYPEIIAKFGGHAMAAGLSIQQIHINDFNTAFVDEVAKTLTSEQCVGEVLSDGPLQQNELKLDTAGLIKNASPWGQGFPEPLFDNEFEIIEQRLLGGKHLKLSLCLADNDKIIEAIAFNIDESMWPNYRAKNAHVVYRLDENRYQGRVKLQLMIEHISAIE
jgi:single-stranded-DNA-specific exonuclease